ncbi:DUF1690-domain-containing protein [Sodiomyces alkalinus F11]|uniref:DUF1690-domain-containing protein n=1 Tax=Sodiomyces alkalinus (strain CBS 110278 / VKM F-3762 / F11) TaxID=1314773 RepID=A0A3N2Q2E0_SODAK|nr:DUF1690-domain-containing protein [Sodiomyces alkalinus F11]ROT40907.1 DUF1690-domain-containing protein [Sodiomyces alkalinus F11]
MGASESKPSSGTSPYLWKSSTPTSVSHDLAESLQNSHETDTSRAQLTEIQIQARVADALKELEGKSTDALKKKIATVGEEVQPPADGPSRQSVTREIESLRSKLEERRKVRDLPEGVENARNEVVRCLRENDRRPLDCWQEVEAFKREVKNWEKGWVEKVIS